MVRNAPRVSVLIPVYNRERVLAEAITSVLNQTFSDFELLLCDDGSTDRSVEIIESFGDPRIRLIRNGRNMGSSATRNRLAAEARGEYCAILDSDDVAYDYRLQTQIDFLDSHPGVDVCTGGVVLINGTDGVETGEQWANGVRFHEKIKACTLFECAVPQTTMMYRRDRFSEAGLVYPEGPSNDMGIYRDAVHKLRFHNIETPLVKYRVWDSQMTASVTRQRERALDHLRYAYAGLGVELSGRESGYLTHMLCLTRPARSLFPAYRNLCRRVFEANKSKRIYDPDELNHYMRMIYKRGLRLFPPASRAFERINYMAFKRELARMVKDQGTAE